MKAYEYMGFLCERDQNYFDAASNYEVAWKLCKNLNPTIGLLKKYIKFPKIKISFRLQISLQLSKDSQII